MKRNGKEFEIEELVFRVFMKHVKANNLYIAFRWSVNHENSYKDIIHILSSILCGDKYYHGRDKVCRIGGAFTSARSLTDIYKIMNGERGKYKVKNDVQFQTSIMTMVNILIHSCIEHAVTHDIHILEKIGSDVFTEVGKSLFGDDFKDLTEESLDPRQREFMERMKELKVDVNGFPPPNDSDGFFRAMGKMKQELQRGRNYRLYASEPHDDFWTIAYGQNDWDDLEGLNEILR